MEKAISVFFKCYFWLMLVVSIAGATELYELSLKNAAQVFFTLLGFVGLYNYVFTGSLLPALPWKPLILLFFTWEVYCYIFITKTLDSRLITLALLLPKYYGMFMFGFRGRKLAGAASPAGPAS
jgi:hypothetical protein